LLDLAVVEAYPLRAKSSGRLKPQSRPPWVIQGVV
jgi:hypothetical protein